MDDVPLALFFSALAGIGIGLLYFGSLWLTITKAPALKNPGVFRSLSFVLRTLIIIGGFYLIADGRLERLAVAMLAFFLTRFVCIRYFRPQETKKPAKLR